jgi:hypothetical protein
MYYSKAPTLTPVITVLLFGLIACNTEESNNVTIAKNRNTLNSKTTYTGLHGTWVRHGKYGFTLIEIIDTAHVTYYQFGDRKEHIDTITHNRYFYHKSQAKMGFWHHDSTSIWIMTDYFRFDYRVAGNDLVEHDKMGDQGRFIKVADESSM